MSYTNRYIEVKTVESIDGTAVTDADGWTCTAPDSALPLLAPGTVYELETQDGPFGRITGFRVAGVWHRHDTDQDIEDSARKFREDIDRRRGEALDRNRADWTGRTEMLPGWLQDRVQTFRERGGENFDLNGWGYELAVCELAVLYEKHGYPTINDRSKYDDLPQELHDYDQAHGCSGNQHDMACALVQAHQAGKSLAGTVSALSPITGDAFYENSA